MVVDSRISREEQINNLTSEIIHLEKDRDRLCEYRKYEKSANDVFAMYKAFMDAGFNEDRAWMLTMKMVDAAVARN